MREKKARRIFAATLKRPCPTCGAKVDEVCRSNAVWVHLDRMLAGERGEPASEWPERVRPLEEES